MLNTSHQLYRLSKRIDWLKLEREIPALLDNHYRSHWRLVSGAIYLKSFYDMSTEDVIKKWDECPYYRYFCSGDLTTSKAKPFPVSPPVLESLSCELIGGGYDAMIRALANDLDDRSQLH